MQVRDAETSLRRSLRKSQAELAAVLAHVDVLQVALTCRHAYTLTDTYLLTQADTHLLTQADTLMPALTRTNLPLSSPGEPE